MAGLVLRERRQAANYDFTQLPYVDWQLTEYTGGGKWRDWYAPFDGLELDSHERNHYEQAMIYRADELAHQRRLGRWAGRSVTVAWTPGIDPESDNLARWIEKHGSNWGVHVERL